MGKPRRAARRRGRYLVRRKLAEAQDGSLACLSWLNHDADGHFVGQLSDPMDVDVGPDGPRVIGR
jgi:hypothetical protein